MRRKTMMLELKVLKIVKKIVFEIGYREGFSKTLFFFFNKIL